jgi:hypothetical protein
MALMLILVVSVSCASQRLWVQPGPNEKINSFLDIPLLSLQREPEKYTGKIFEGQVKFYRIYRNKKDAIPSLSTQVIAGKTHFTARPISQYTNVVQIQITPRQDKKMREMKVHRQDVLHVRVRFVGLSEGGALAFKLMEILP